MGILAFAILKNRLLDIELLAYETLARGVALVVLVVPLVAGVYFAKNFAGALGPLLFRATGTLAASILCFSLGIMFLRQYKEPVTRRLVLFFLILGLWLAWELPLDMPPYVWSVPLYRLAYAWGCFTLLAWLDWWRGYFQQPVQGPESKVQGPTSNVRTPKTLDFGLWTLDWCRRVRWSAGGMAALSVFTPWVLKSLQFDPMRINPALEVPGTLYGAFAAWFLTMSAWSAGWVLAAFYRAYRDLTRPAFVWILGALASGLAGAAAYFLYVERLLSFPVHPFLAMACCACLTGSLLTRGQVNVWQERHVDLWMGATSLAYPFGVGALLAQDEIVFRTAAMLSSVFLVPRLFKATQESLAQWLNEVFKGRKSFRHSLHLTRQQSYRMSNLPDLVEESMQQVAQRLGVERATLYFHDLTSNQFIAIGPEAEKMPVYGEDHPLVSALMKGPVFGQQVDRPAGPAGGLPKGAAAAAPLYQENGLFGFFLIGPERDPNLPVTARAMEEARLDIEHPMMIAHIYYENAVTLDKFCHDNIRYAGNIRLFLNSFLLGGGANFPTALDQRLAQLLQQPGPPEDVREDLRQTQGELADFKEGLTSVTRRADSEASLLERNLRDLREKMTTLAKRMQGKYGMGRYDMRELVLEALAGMRGRAQEVGIELISNLEASSAMPREGSPPKLAIMGWGERQNIRYLLENLLHNALKFTPIGGIVRVEARDLGPNLEVMVSDTGPGIPPEALPHIFDLFYQGPGRHDMQDSTGIGLSIVREIVALHGGNVDVISEEGQGTTFFVRLPSARSALEAKAA